MSIPPVIALMGPTASGKTHLAVTLAQVLPIEIISVDSALIYQEMNIGTAKPDAETLKKAPHHLIDLIQPNETYSVARFCTDALALIKTAHAQGRIPLLVGGTMMYFNALFHGMDALPEGDETLRGRLTQQLHEEGLSTLYALLEKHDLETASRLHPTDTQRILRALEIYFLTGNPMSVLLQRGKREAFSAFPHSLMMFHLVPSERAVLHQRIEQRFMEMLSNGFLEEVIFLKEKYQLNAEMSSMRCVGYRQALTYLDSLQTRTDYSLLQERGIIATRQLAKRQLTWLRNQPRAAESYDLDCLDLDKSYQKLLMLVEKKWEGSK